MVSMALGVKAILHIKSVANGRPHLLIKQTNANMLSQDQILHLDIARPNIASRYRKTKYCIQMLNLNIVFQSCTPPCIANQCQYVMARASKVQFKFNGFKFVFVYIIVQVFVYVKCASFCVCQVCKVQVPCGRFSPAPAAAGIMIPNLGFSFGKFRF